MSPALLRLAALKLSLMILLLSSSVFAADVDVLIIGSETDTSQNSAFSGSSKAFSPSGVRSELQKILQGAGLGSVNVVVEDHRKTEGSRYSNNLASWYHWPYPAGAEQTRWANLRGQNGTDWDYIVLIGDPYTIEYMPGLYTHGVAKVTEEIAMGNAEPVLLMGWPASSSVSTVAHYKEVVYRTGRSGGIKVAPAGLAWQAAGSPTTANQHPGNAGAYIAAATLYSRIWNKSASESTYTYDDALANTVHDTVSANVGKVQYNGAFNFQSPFSPYGDFNRLNYLQKVGGGSSTEEGFENHYGPARDSAGMAVGGSRFRVGRDVYPGAGAKDYRNGGYTARVFGYRYQTEYTNNNDVHVASIMSQDIDLADQMIAESNSFRVIPRRLLWAQFHKLYPDDKPMPDNEHLNHHALRASGHYMSTMVSGRCGAAASYVYQEEFPYEDERAYHAARIGYETAWHVTRCQVRAPGLKIIPSDRTQTGHVPQNSQTMAVQFVYPPQSDVTVNISLSKSSAASLSATRLTFTPENYSDPQIITITTKSGLGVDTSCNVIFNTSSEDEVYNGLYDRWQFDSLSGYELVTLSTAANTGLAVTLPDATATIATEPSHGSLSGTIPNLTYTPANDYIGMDAFSYYVNGSLFRVDVAVGLTQALIQAEADATIRGGTNGNANYGSGDSLAVSHSTNSTNYRRSYLRFDLNDIPADALSIKLRLYTSWGGDAIVPRYVHLVNNDNWQENTITWNNAPAAGASIKGAIATTSYEYSEVDLTQLIQTHSDGKLSLLIDVTGGTEWVQFASREHGNSNLRPSLVIYTDDSELGPVQYSTWAAGPFSQPFTDTAMTSNPDGDRNSNMMEFAFGTDPTLMDMGPLSTDGNAHGAPLLQPADGGGFELYFVRRDDHGSPGSLNYTACFSSDLVNFYESEVSPTPVADSKVNSDYEIVKVAYPAVLDDGQPAKFGRVQVVPVEEAP